MKKIITLKEYQYKILELLEKLVLDFKKNNIEWFAHSGTLLGAIRHGDIIPWDDDVDMGMDYKTYIKNEELIAKIIKKNFKNDYNFKKLTSFNNFFPDMAKIESKKVYDVLVDGVVHKKRIFLDIMVGMNQIEMPISLIRYHVYKAYIYFAINQYLGKIKFFHFLIKRNRKSFLRVLDKLSQQADGNKTKFKLFYSFSWRKDTFDISKIEWKKFGNFKIPCPKNWDEVLKNSFGDYMIPPPLKKQKPKHDAKKRF